MYIYIYTIYITDLSNGDLWVHHQLGFSMVCVMVNDGEYSEHPKIILSQVGEPNIPE